jgi:hypothetical protein
LVTGCLDSALAFAQAVLKLFAFGILQGKALTGGGCLPLQIVEAFQNNRDFRAQLFDPAVDALAFRFTLAQPVVDGTNLGSLPLQPSSGTLSFELEIGK